MDWLTEGLENECEGNFGGIEGGGEEYMEVRKDRNKKVAYGIWNVKLENEEGNGRKNGE